ncbi:thioredoxin family protein [Pedobacter psychroterrae]|nr:DUF255 domain-containing protein [Pedobacter psychroterrae]
MKRFLLAITLYLVYLVPAEAQGIVFFEGSWAQALEKAKEEKKLVFLDCYTVWCAPCLEMAKETFPRKDVGDFFNQYFISVKVDMQKGEGPVLKDRYAVNGYPTMMFVNGDGYPVSTIYGKHNAEALLKWAKDVNNGRIEISLEQEFNAGNRSEALVDKYFLKIITDKQFAKLDSVINLMANDNGDEILLQAAYFNALNYLPIDSRAVQYFTLNHKKYAQKYGSDMTHKKLSEIYVSYKQLATMYDTKPPRSLLQDGYEKLINGFYERKLPYSDFMVAQVDFYIAMRNQDDLRIKSIAEKALKNASAWQYLCFADFNTNQNPIRNTSMAEIWLIRAMGEGDSGVFKAKVKDIAQRYSIIIPER